MERIFAPASWLVITPVLGSVAAGCPDGAGGLALETAGGEQRMLFKDGCAATK